MDGEEVTVIASGVGPKGRSEEARLRKSVRVYWVFLHVASAVILVAPLLAPKARPDAAPAVPAAYDLPVTCITFAVATLLLQGSFARVMERRPAPAPFLNPLFAWQLAVGTWLVGTGCFVGYLSFGDRYLSQSCSEWVAAGVASAANLAMAAHTVTRYFA